MQMRPTVAGDLPALKGVIGANQLFPEDMLDDMIAGYLSGNAGGEIWLTLEAETPLGLAYCIPEKMTDGAWNLLLIAVHPAHQDKGCGSALMRRLEEELALKRQRILLVETSGLPDFARTRAFYSRRGYEIEGRIRDFYQAGEDKIIFRKALSR